MSIDNSRGLVGIIVDMQKGFLDDFTKTQKDNLINEQIKVIEKLNELNLPRIVLEFRSYGKTHPEIINQVEKIEKFKYITKGNDNGFSNPELYSTLRDWGSREIILMGINASFCVKATAEEARKRGYEILTGKKVIANEDLVGYFGGVIEGKKLFEMDFNGWYKNNTICFTETQDLVNYATSLIS